MSDSLSCDHGSYVCPICLPYLYGNKREDKNACKHDLGWIATWEITKDGATLDDREFKIVWRCKACRAEKP